MKFCYGKMKKVLNQQERKIIYEALCEYDKKNKEESELIEQLLTKMLY